MYIRQNVLLKPKPAAYFTLSCELCMTTRKKSVSVIGNIKGMSHVTIMFGVLVVQFLLGNSPASVCYWPTFRNSLSVPSS
jgi:hypothetical protein